MNIGHFIEFVLLALLPTFQLSLASNLPKAATTSDECFEHFGERTTNAAHIYADDYERCQHHRATRRTRLTRDKEVERQQIENGAAEICGSMQNCNNHGPHEDFFNCHTDISFDNMDTLISIHLNASAAVIDLSTQYEQAEKEARLCAIEAQRDYMTETKIALKELRMCLEQL